MTLDVYGTASSVDSMAVVKRLDRRCKLLTNQRFNSKFPAWQIFKIIGVLGRDQLGRMLQEAANGLNVKTITLEKGPDSPSK